MASPLQILHLEDDPNDVELIHETLRTEKVDCTIEVVSSREGFVEALDRARLDLILSDYSVPGFDGLGALALAKERAEGVPFILVSGTLGEEAAIESMKSGATDYVLKTRLTRLAPAVRRALGEAAEARKRSRAERMFRSLLEAAPDAMVITDRGGRIVLVNVQAEQMFGHSRSDLLGQGFDILLPPRSVGAHAALREHHFKNPAAHSAGPAVELPARHKSGREFPVEISLSPLETEEGLLLTSAIREVTDRKELEAQLHQAQKMEAIGRLAGGVAHDFNNLLNVIIGYGEMLLDHAKADDPQRSKLEQILTASARAASLTRQLLAFSRKQVIEMKVLDLNAIAAETQKMLGRLIGEDIELVVQTEPGLGWIKADRGQIEQIVMNLAVNARDAMPRGGRLTLKTANLRLDEAGARGRPGAQPGAYVALSMIDTGSGMNPEVKARIFEPFFTTKPPGEGTGLGLATVYGIVKQSAGFIFVESQPGKGTTFEIGFPAVVEQAARADSKEQKTTPASGSETILLVEDEVAVRGLARESLERYGYTVLEAADVGAARHLCEKYPATIHLLLTDMVMPRMNGRQLAALLAPMRPGMRVLFMSGYSDDTLIKQGALDSGSGFLQKPFTPSALARKVRDVLDQTIDPAVAS